MPRSAKTAAAILYRCAMAHVRKAPEVEPLGARFLYVRCGDSRPLAAETKRRSRFLQVLGASAHLDETCLFVEVVMHITSQASVDMISKIPFQVHLHITGQIIITNPES